MKERLENFPVGYRINDFSLLSSINFILGLNFIFFCFKLIIIHYHTQKQKKIKFKPTIKLTNNIYFQLYSLGFLCSCFVSEGTGLKCS